MSAVAAAPRAHGAPPDDAPFLGRRARRTVAALAEVLFPPAEGAMLTPGQVADEVDRQLRRMRQSKRIRSLHLVLFVVEYVLPLAGIAALGVHVRPFSRLDPARRTRLVDRTLARTRFKPLRTLAKLKTLLLAAYYSDPGVQARIGFVQVRDRGLDTAPAPAGRIRVRRPAGRLQVDVCVIGSGAGGAVVAARAASAGRTVALLEEGPYVAGDAVVHDEHAMVAALYRLDARDLVRRGVPDADAIAARVDAAVHDASDLLLNSSHPQGGNPMSDDRRVGVVGTDFRVRGTRNLFVADASVFPTSIHVNPQLTIMAMAGLAWEHGIAEAT